MKVTIDIDCSAKEAREMLGLPDVSKIQEQWVAKVGEKMMGEVENLSPETILKSWTSGASSNMDWLPNMFTAFTQPGKGK